MFWLIDIILHLDKYLGVLLDRFGILTYVILFFIIFFETGVVITPFLPGDSLLFTAGALASLDGSPLDPVLLFFVLAPAAIIGDGVNYWLGHRMGPKVFSREDSLLLNKKYLFKAQNFYEKYGKKTIFLARFVPVIRTFAPFVAGVGRMPYRDFLVYNVAGAAVWVGLFVSAGYFFGNLPFVKEHFSVIVVAIIIVSFVPIGVDVAKSFIKGDEPGEGEGARPPT